MFVKKLHNFQRLPEYVISISTYSYTPYSTAVINRYISISSSYEKLFSCLFVIQLRGCK